MGKIYEKVITRFDGAISKDIRANIDNKYALTKHFDTFTFPKKLIPYKSFSALETTSFLVREFIYAPYNDDGTMEYRLFGHGVRSGKNGVFVYDIDASAAAWAEPTNAVSGLSYVLGCFFYYKNFLYMWGSTNKLTRYDVVNLSWNDAYQTIAFTKICQPVHHPADDCAYFSADNKVYRLDDTTWDGNVQTVPDNMEITGICPHGNYLAIACVTKGTSRKKSTVFLWDRDSSLTTFSETIDFGTGEIKHIASLENRLTAVVYPAAGLSTQFRKYKIKQAVGNYSLTINELTRDSSVNSIPTYTIQEHAVQYISENKLYFVGAFEDKGDSRLGIWAVDSNGRLSLEVIDEEATVYYGIYNTGDMWWTAIDNGQVNQSSASSYTNTSKYESIIFNHEDSDLKKKLIGATVMTEPLPTTGQVVLKYCKDADLDNQDGSVDRWTTIFTHTTYDSISHGSINIESSGATLPEFKEIQFRIEATGGAVITGLKFKYYVFDKSLY